MVIVKEVTCRSVLSKCGIEDIDYSLNPYIGCEHGCVYCYARYMKRYTGHREEWGEFVDVKINAPVVLSREISSKTKGLVILSTVTDPYQPLERRYKLTRRCLERLLLRQFPVNILTKSSLVLRDFDVLSKFKSCDIGVTVITEKEELREVLEPHSSPIRERLEVLKRFSEVGIPTYAFIGPVIPGVTDGEEDLERLLESLICAGVDSLLVDRLNPRSGVPRRILKLLKRYFPSLVGSFQKKMDLYDVYYEDFKTRFSETLNEVGITYEFCY